MIGRASINVLVVYNQTTGRLIKVFVRVPDKVNSYLSYLFKREVEINNDSSLALQYNVITNSTTL